MPTPRSEELSGVLSQAGRTAAVVRHLPDVARRRGAHLLACRRGEDRAASCRDTPVVLVHGFAASVECWTPLREQLVAAGFDQLFLFVYNGLVTGPSELARSLAAEVTSVLTETGSETVHLVGHSLGGLVVRLAAEWCGLWTRASTVVTIATPHHGCALAWAAPGPAARWMRTGRRPTMPEPDLRVPGPRYVNFYASRDAVLSRRSALLQADGVRNLEIEGAGHIGATRAEFLLARLPQELAEAEIAHRHGGQRLPATRFPPPVEPLEPAWSVLT